MSHTRYSKRSIPLILLFSHDMLSGSIKSAIMHNRFSYMFTVDLSTNNHLPAILPLDVHSQRYLHPLLQKQLWDWSVLNTAHQVWVDLARVVESLSKSEMLLPPFEVCVRRLRGHLINSISLLPHDSEQFEKQTNKKTHKGESIWKNKKQ